MSSSYDMTPTEIRINLLRAGVSQIEIARELGVTRQLIYLVVEGKVVSDRVRRHMANKIGIDVKLIWPSTYLYKQAADQKTYRSNRCAIIE